MADLKIDYADLQTAIQLSKDISKELGTSYQTVTQLRNYLEGAAWSGQTKDAFQVYLALIHQYHKVLNDIMKEHKKAVNDLKKKIDDLSFGNRKKVGIVQALLHEPRLIILDEPTSGLDPMGIKMLRDLILRLNAEFGMTIFMNTHLISEIAKTCTSIAVLSHGKLVFHDRIEAVTARYGDDTALEELYLSLTPVGRLSEVA